MRFKFQAVHTRLHSPRTLASPRNENCLNPSTDLMIPNTGSTVCLRNAYRVRPNLVLSLWAIFRAAVALSGNASGSLWRSRQSGWCSSRATAINESIFAASHAWMFFSL